MTHTPERRTTELIVDAMAAHPGDFVHLDDLLQPLRSRAFGFLLLLLAIPNFIPVPIGIGGVMGVLVVALGLQMLCGMEHPWVPRRLRRRSIRRQTVQRFLQRSGPLLRRLERICRPRMEPLTRRPASILTGLLLVLTGVLLALPIPFTNYLFGALLLAYAVALIERDGALLLGLWIASSSVVGLSASFSTAVAEVVTRWF